MQRQISYDIIYMWNLKNNTNVSIYKAETDSQKETECIVTKGEREWEGINEKYGINRHTLLHIKLTNNKNLLCNTWNNIQYLVIIYNGQ